MNPGIGAPDDRPGSVPPRRMLVGIVLEGLAVLWWGLYVIALGVGGAWTAFGPLLMTFLLLKVSGVTLLERDIGGRRPAYAEYARRTSAFIPLSPRAPRRDAASDRSEPESGIST